MIDFAVRPSEQPCPAAERQRLLADPGFGRVFTDHMITIDWTHDRGWHDAALHPYGPLTLDQLPRYCTTPRKSSRGRKPTGGQTARW